MTDHFYGRPCAAPGLTSYRYRLPFSYVMIGAADDTSALAEAERSIVGRAKADKLEVWKGDKYVPVKG